MDFTGDAGGEYVLSHHEWWATGRFQESNRMCSRLYDRGSSGRATYGTVVCVSAHGLTG